VIPNVNLKGKKIRFWMLFIAGAFFIIALARPRWGRIEENLEVSGRDVLIGFDVSKSMWAEDIYPSRLKRSKKWVENFLNKTVGDRFGLIPFAGSAYVSTPLTTDIRYLLESLSLLSPELISNQGTSFLGLMETAEKAFEVGAEDAVFGSRILIIVSDGEDHTSGAEAMAKRLESKGVIVYTIGVGELAGAPIPVRDANGNLKGYKKDRSGMVVKTSMNPKSLQQIAQLGGGKYFHLTQGETEIDLLLADMKGYATRKFGKHKVVRYAEKFQFPLALGIFFLMFSLFIDRTKMAAAAFLVWALLFSQHSQADSLSAYLSAKEGLKLLKEGKQEEAKKLLEEAAIENPDDPKILYNLGLAEYSNGNLNRAAEHFEEAAKKAYQQGDEKFAAKALFNKGAVLQQAGENEAALKPYTRSIEQSEKLNEKELEHDSRKNIELLLDQMRQQSQNGEGDEKKDNEDKDEKNGKKNNDSDDDKNKKEKKFKEDHSNKWKKISKKDAENIMKQMSQKDQETKERLSNRTRGTGNGGGKDW